MELSVKERLVLAENLPRQGNIITMRLIHALQEAIGFSDAEHVRWVPVQGYDITQGCPRCPGEEVSWESIPHAPLHTKCSRCGFIAGLGVQGVVWRTHDEEGNELDQTAEIEIGEAGMNLIADTLELFNTNEELNDDLVPLYERFVEEQGAIVGEGD